jgi:hypothetical protein
MEWLTYCLNPRATTFDLSVYGPEDPAFIEHRTEQAIMTLLAHKYGILLEPELDYEQGLFQQLNHHDLSGGGKESQPPLGSRFRNV